jgi:hypothetical protein
MLRIIPDMTLFPWMQLPGFVNDNRPKSSNIWTDTPLPWPTLPGFLIPSSGNNWSHLRPASDIAYAYQISRTIFINQYLDHRRLECHFQLVQMYWGETNEQLRINRKPCLCRDTCLWLNSRIWCIVGPQRVSPCALKSLWKSRQKIASQKRTGQPRWSGKREWKGVTINNIVDVKQMAWPSKAVFETNDRQRLMLFKLVRMFCVVLDNFGFR